MSISLIRNIGIIAHIDAGKTTTTEWMLRHTGVVHRAGTVDEGTTTTDYLDQERERGITIVAAAITCSWQGHHINIIDTPGHVDFTAEVERALRVLDGGVVVLDGTAGVEAQTETVWRQADKYAVPRLCFVNKMDRIGADLDQAIVQLRRRLGARAVAIQLPLGKEAAFHGVVDLVRMVALDFPSADEAPVEIPMPDSVAEQAAEARRQLVESVADVDDEILTAYLDGRVIMPDELQAAIRRATVTSHLVPVLCGAALRDRGIQPLLDAVVAYLPSPANRPPIVGIDPRDGSTVARAADSSAPFAALAFKVVVDQHAGRLVYIRVYSGTVAPGTSVYVPSAGKSERLGRLVRMHAGNRMEVKSEVGPGEIVAVVGLKLGRTGDTLCTASHPVALETLRFPEPVVRQAIEARTKAEETELTLALAKLSDEDPTFEVAVEKETGQTVMAGMGELHLEVMTERLRREFNLAVKVGRPQVAYRETITAPASAEGRFIRQTGGRGHYGHVRLQVEPLAVGSGIEFRNEASQSEVPAAYVSNVEQGARGACQVGPVAGYPLIDLRIVLTGGSYHEVDSSDVAFQAAGVLALNDAVERAQPVLLEPYMAVEVTCPEESVGNIIADLSSRRGHVLEIGVRGNGRVVPARVPLAELFGYVTTLRSLTSGRGTFTMQFSHYEPAPPRNG